MSVHETVISLAWLVAELEADTTFMGLTPGGIHRALAPATDDSGNQIATPYAILAFQSGLDTLTVNAYRVITQPLFQAKAVGPASNTAAIAASAARMDDLIKRASGTVTGGIVLSCFREQLLMVDELVSNAQWTNIGGLYRLLIQQA